MAMVKAWFKGWKDKVRERVTLARAPWPRGRHQVWDEMFEAFCDAEATELMGQGVLAAMEAAPRLDADDALAVFRVSLSDAKAKAKQDGLTTRQKARSDSANLSRCEKWGDPLPCPRCGGEGLALFRRADGEPHRVRTDGGHHASVEELPMCCDLCPSGRWFAANSSYPDPVRKPGEYVWRDEAILPASAIPDPAAPAEPDRVRLFKAELDRELAESVPF